MRRGRGAEDDEGRPSLSPGSGRVTVPTIDPQSRARALIEAASLVASTTDLAALLPALAGQARQLLAADRAEVELGVGGEIQSSDLALPLVAGGQVFGVLRVGWDQPVELDPDDVAAARAIATHAAIAVRAQRLRGRAESNEARVATIVEHLPCGILILDAAGKVVMVNEAVGRITGVVPSGLDPLVQQLGTFAVRDPSDGGPFAPGESPIEAALGGELVEAREALFRRPGESAERRAHISAAPMRDRVGGVRGAVVVLTEITEQHRATAERARLDGAVKTARLISHELNNKLTVITANAELLVSDVEGEARQFAEEIVRGAEDAAAIVARLNQIVRFEETDLGLGEPVLDLDAATSS